MELPTGANAHSAHRDTAVCERHAIPNTIGVAFTTVANARSAHGNANRRKPSNARTTNEDSLSLGSAMDARMRWCIGFGV